MKAAMISVQPKWCELIACGKKTIEVRKTKPKIEVPFKCYIYCTYGNALADLSNCLCENIENDVKIGNIRRYALQEHKITEPIISSCAYGNGKVIGEFICDRIEQFEYVKEYQKIKLDSDDFEVAEFGNCEPFYNAKVKTINETQLTQEDLVIYGKGKPLYGWHISDLKIYDKPKEIREFWKADICKHLDGGCDCWYDLCGIAQNNDCHLGHIRLRKPPQSWCYVEGLQT